MNEPTGLARRITFALLVLYGLGTMVGGGSAAASEYGLTHLMDCGAEGLRAENACEDRIGSNEGDLGGERDDEDDDNPTDIDTDQPGL